MTLRRIAALIALLLIVPSVAAGQGRFDRDGSYVTANFRVHAPSRELAEKFGDFAEHYRKEKAIEWLGQEMPQWREPCPLKVEITTKRSGGATTFTFGTQPGVLAQEMHIFGETRQLLYSVLPHEVTHTVLAHYFGRAVPRWADEGGSVLSENEEEWFNHDIRCREILNAGRGIRLRVLFTLKEYPRDMIVVYAQGYSVCDFLINEHQGGRAAFLRFVGIGMRNNNRNWDQAVREVYGYNSVDELEETWIEHLRQPPRRVAARTKDKPAAALASRTEPIGTEPITPARQLRTSGGAAIPLLEEPAGVVRGVAPDMPTASCTQCDSACPTCPKVQPNMQPIAPRPAIRPDHRPPPISLLEPPIPPRQ